MTPCKIHTGSAWHERPSHTRDLTARRLPVHRSRACGTRPGYV